MKQAVYKYIKGQSKLLQLYIPRWIYNNLLLKKKKKKKKKKKNYVLTTFLYLL